MSRVGDPPAPGGPFGQELLPSRATLTCDDPRSHVIGIVSGMSFVIESELLDGTVARPEIVEFEPKFPGSLTTRTRDNRGVHRIRWYIVG